MAKFLHAQYMCFYNYVQMRREAICNSKSTLQLIMPRAKQTALNFFLVLQDSQYF